MLYCFFKLPSCPIWSCSEWWRRPPSLRYASLLHQQRWRLGCPCGITTTRTTPAVCEMKNATSVIPELHNLRCQLESRTCVILSSLVLFCINLHHLAKLDQAAKYSQVFFLAHRQEHQPQTETETSDGSTYSCPILWYAGAWQANMSQPKYNTHTQSMKLWNPIHTL